MDAYTLLTSLLGCDMLFDTWVLGTNPSVISPKCLRKLNYHVKVCACIYALRFYYKAAEYECWGR